MAETVSTEIRTLKSKEELPNTTDTNEIAGLPTTQIQDAHPRIFSQTNINTTHTQRGAFEAEMANLKLGSNLPISDKANTSKTNEAISSSQTLMNIERGQNVVKVAINSRAKRMCTFMPQKCNCSDRLTMQKTKFILYICPFFLVIACFYVLLTQQKISGTTFVLILLSLILSFIAGWIAILGLLLLLQCILMIRDAIFWCIVKKFRISILPNIHIHMLHPCTQCTVYIINLYMI